MILLPSDNAQTATIRIAGASTEVDSPMLPLAADAVRGGQMGSVRLTVRLDFRSGEAVGPGKIRLLETIAQTGSISRAGRALGMSYRRSWLLIDDLNRSFREPVITTRPGGTRGGGAELTPFGFDLIKKYRAIETKATAAAKRQLDDLEVLLRQRPTLARKRLKRSIRTHKAG
jgi:molybdate transport system regulatory protein